MLFETVDYIPLDTLFAALQINRATGYRYLKRISEVLSSVNVWVYETGDGSLDKEGIQIFEIYTKLALEHSPKFAAKNLIKELKKHGYTIPETTQKQHTNNRRNTTGQRTESATNEQQPNTKPSDFYDSLFGL